MNSPGDEPTLAGDATTRHLRRAVSGDRESLSWIVDRFTPLLVAAARYRLGTRLQRLCDPEDVVADLWLATLPALPELSPRDGHITPVLLRYLSSSLVHRVNNLARKHVVRRGDSLDREIAEGPGAAEPAAEITGVVTRAVRREAESEVAVALSELSESDREIIILRGIEQSSTEEVARMLDVKPVSVRSRYHRALRRVRERLPGAVFDELTE